MITASTIYNCLPFIPNDNDNIQFAVGVIPSDQNYTPSEATGQGLWSIWV